MILKRLTSVLTIKRKTSTDLKPTGFLENDSVVTPMIQDGAVTPIKLSTKYEKFDAVVGSSAQVTAGLASHSTLASAIADVSSGGTILVLPGTYSESITLTKKVFIRGQGNASNLTGTFTFDSGSSLSSVTFMRFGDNVTINSSGADGIFFRLNHLASGKLVTDNGAGNDVSFIQE